MPYISHDINQTPVTEINISEINIDDYTYKISSDIDLADLCASIKTIGLINPPFVKKCRDYYVVVSGFRRIKALILNESSTAMVRVLPEQICVSSLQVKQDDEELAEHCAVFIAIVENAFQRPLNTMEQIRAVMLLKKIMNENQIAEKSGDILNLNMNTALVKRLLTIGAMPEKLHMLIEKGELSMTAALKLDQYDMETINAFICLFESIRVGLNKQVEIITNIHEIAVLEDKNPVDIIRSDSIKNIIEDNNSDKQKRGRLIRSFLLKWRYPHLKEALEKFDNNVKQLKLGNELNLSAPVNFEAMDYTFSFKFKNMNELESRIKKLETICCNPVLRHIIS